MDDDQSTLQQYSVSDALKCMRDDNVSGHVVSNEDCASLAAALAQRRVKDSVPHKTLAKAIAPLADRCFRMGKELHLMLIGCNTIKAVPHLKRAIPANAQGVVTVLCTSEVWPSDCSTMLWCLYGTLARTKDLNSFRAQTRALLGTYTDHYQRQSIQDVSRQELKITDSLANAVHCDRLSDVQSQLGGDAIMQLL